MSQSAVSVHTGRILSVNQTGHGFAVGNVIRGTNLGWTKAQANNVTNAEAVGIVVGVVDADNFTYQHDGLVTGLSGLTATTLYFLSSTTAGAVTATEPSAPGDVSKPVLWALSATTALFWNMRGIVIGTGPGAELGYANRTSDDTTTNTNLASTANKMAGVAVTVVGTGRPVKVEFFSPVVYHSVAGGQAGVTFLINGSVTGGQLGGMRQTNAGGAGGVAVTVSRRFVLTAGTTYTFEIGKWVITAGTGTFQNTADQPTELTVTAA